jgi:hypothetical protein
MAARRRKVERPGPPVVKQGGAKAAVRADGEPVHLALDPGVFNWLWGIVEAKVQHAESKPHMPYTFPEYLDMIHRAQAEFRAAGGPPEPEKDVPRKKVVRKVR